jgi:formate dehydrogenase major subunit
MGPIQTCDTCMVEVDGQLVRSCGVKVSQGMAVVTDSKRAMDARSEAFDVILGNHLLYCTVCDNNNENCTVHNTAVAMKVEHQRHPFKPKPYPVAGCRSADRVASPAATALRSARATR